MFEYHRRTCHTADEDLVGEVGADISTTTATVIAAAMTTSATTIVAILRLSFIRDGPSAHPAI